MNFQYEGYLNCSESEPDWSLDFLLVPYNLHPHNEPTRRQGYVGKRIFDFKQKGPGTSSGDVRKLRVQRERFEVHYIERLDLRSVL